MTDARAFRGFRFPAEVIGSSLETGYDYDAKGQGELIREPKVELNNNNSGKAEGRCHVNEGCSAVVAVGLSARA